MEKKKRLNSCSYPCIKCKQHTSHSSGVCKVCRVVVCPKCGKKWAKVKTKTDSKFCSGCGGVYSKILQNGFELKEVWKN